MSNKSFKKRFFDCQVIKRGIYRFEQLISFERIKIKYDKYTKTFWSKQAYIILKHICEK